MANSEITRLRKAQAKAVMPMIGPLLDAWEGLPNDFKDSEELEALNEHLSAINSAMEDAE
jgi:hypothetical protein